MLHHVELHVSDLERTIAFWTPLMALLDYTARRWSGGITYEPTGNDRTYLCLLQAPREHLSAGYHRKRVGLNHLAFAVASREQVDAVAGWLRQHQHPLLYEDRHPFAGGPGYYAVFFEDPDRIKLEVAVSGS